MIVLQEHRDGRQSVRVMQSRADGARSYYDGVVLYTQVDAGGNNLLTYIDAMVGALSSAADTLILGIAGGALATQLHRRGATVTAVDIWGPAFDLARRWFDLPDAVNCIQADAADFLRGTELRWDAIAIDVFQGVEIPPSMLGHDIGGLLHRALAPEGRVVWNVADTPGSLPVRRVCRILQSAGLDTKTHSVLDGGVGNTLVVGQLQTVTAP